MSVPIVLTAEEIAKSLGSFEIVRDLADSDPGHWDADNECCYCFFCGRERPAREAEIWHEDDCLWVRANECYGVLRDKEG